MMQSLLKTSSIVLKKKQQSQQPPSRPISKDLIDKIIQLRDDAGQPLYEKFNIESILSNMEKHHIQIVQLFSKYLKDGFNLLEFIRFFLNILPHYHIENLYLAIGLVDLFRQITLETHRDRVVIKDITDYMCDKILKKDRNFNKIEAKFIPFSKFFKLSEQTKQYLKMSPTIYGQTDEKIHKISQKSIKTDSSKHSRAIVKSQFCHDLKKVFILDALSDSISVFDENCSLQQKISPQLSKLKKEVIILSFAFSKRQYRVGAVLKDFSIKFWDHFNNFEYEKSISTTSICQNLQTSIYFLEYFNTWITTDKTGTIHFWNLLEERPDQSMKCKYNAPINGICQIPSHNLIVVVQECKRSSRLLVEHDKNQMCGSEATVVIYNYYNAQIITEINLQGMRIPHTLLYSQSYQVLFMSGLQKKIRIYDLHPVYMDASLKGELIGHQNLITCFSLIANTPMLVSADDKGKVKLWDFRNLMCLQTIDFSDKTQITNILDMIEIGKLGVFGSRVNYIQFEDRYNIIKKRNEEENLKIQSIDFDPNLMEIYIYVDRTFRIIDLHQGQVKHIFSFRSKPDEEFTAFRYFSNQKKILLGNSNGQLSVYSAQTGQFEYTFKGTHEGAILFIQFDEFNKIYISVGYDSKILIHRASDGSLLRQIKNNFHNKEMTCLEISVYHNLMAMGSSTSSSVYLWNYQFCKMVGEIKFTEETPHIMHFINGYGILVVGTNQGKLHVFRTVLTCSDIEIVPIDVVSIGQPILTIYTDLKLEGRAKHINCSSCSLLVYCEGGDLYEYDIQKYLRQQVFRVHCKQKSNYNPYREGKQNFTSELQKMKHPVLVSGKHFSGKVFNNFRKKSTQFTNLNICKLLKMEQSYHVVVGNDKRIKIWNKEHKLLCDLNIKYCLPYRWALKPTSRTIVTEKVYYGIKVLETIAKKYENDISIGESKNLEVRQLFHHLEKNQNTKCKMITEPEELYSNPRTNEETVLLQNEYSKKDLNFELVKRFNFTEIAGPTLKELDNIKKIQNLQKEWKVKEKRQMKEKQSLLWNIESKAKKNEQNNQIQMLFVKRKKTLYKEHKEQNQKIVSLTKKLNSIETRATDDKKQYMTAFYKNVYNRFAHKLDPELRFNFSEPKLNKPNSLDGKQSFEQYYKDKFRRQSCGKAMKQQKIGFRQILTEMNGRVNSIKKYRYRKEKGSLVNIQDSIVSNN